MAKRVRSWDVQGITLISRTHAGIRRRLTEHICVTQVSKDMRSNALRYSCGQTNTRVRSNDGGRIGC